MSKIIFVNLKDKNQVKIMSRNDTNVGLKTILPNTISLKQNELFYSQSQSPAQSPSPSSLVSCDDLMSLSSDDMPQIKVSSTKRPRLKDLTPNEKIMRRKLKNRIAAQSARDRKKARMSELETLVQQLEDENKKLKIENEILNKQSTILLQENNSLKQKQNMKRPNEHEDEIEVKKRKLCAYDDSVHANKNVNSAVVCAHVSQQKRQTYLYVQQSTHMILTYLLLILVGLMSQHLRQQQIEMEKKFKKLRVQLKLVKIIRSIMNMKTRTALKRNMLKKEHLFLMMNDAHTQMRLSPQLILKTLLMIIHQQMNYTKQHKIKLHY